METKMDFITKKGVIKRLLTMALGLIMAVIACVTVLPGTEITVKAAGTGKNLQIGSTVLTPEMSVSYVTPYDPDSKNRITTAQTVYYGGNGTQRWLVIGYNGTGAVGMSNTVTLFAENNLVTGQAYHDPSDPADRSNYYGTSDIKPVVDGYYGTLFTNEEKGIILKRTLATGGFSIAFNSLSDGISDASAVDAYLWLLSTKEADLLKKDYRTASEFWWLRSPGHDGAFAAGVIGLGFVDYAGSDVDDGYGVRPAFNLNLQSIIFTSAAAGGKSSGAVGADALTSVADYTGTDWKVTLLDDGSINSNLNGHAGFTATRVGGGNVAIGDEITLSFGGAQTGSNEYVSAIIVSAADETTPLYYGRIANNTASNTAATVKVPTGISDGDYKLLVFAEQYNGDKKTDFASAFSEIDFTVEGAGNVASTPRPVGGNASSSDSSLDLDTEEETTGDYLDELMVMLEAAIASGTEQTINWSEGTALPGPVMKILEENPKITLVFSYTYQGLDYRVTLPGKYVKYDPEIPWCGPLYLYGLYGKYGTTTAPVTTTTQAGERTYTVISGETLWGIAMRLGTTVEELVRLNNIPNPDRIDIGQIIRY